MQLRFQAIADSWVKGLCSDYSSQVKILGLKHIDKEGEVAHFVDISMRGTNSSEVREHLGSTSSVLSTELTDLATDHMMGVVVAKDCTVCNSLINNGSASFISSASTEEDCAMGYKIFLNSEAVPALLNRLSRKGVAYRVTEISPITPDLRLTSRQLAVLKSAMEMGLYDFPRRITQDELSAKIGIKPSTLNEILRRAERKILGDFLGEQMAAEA